MTVKNIMFLNDIQKITHYFNVGRRKKLTYIQEGDRARVLWGHVTIANNLTIEQLYYFIWGFTSGRERK